MKIPFLKKDGEKKSSDKHYLTGKEIRENAKKNNVMVRKLEKFKKRKAPESEFVTEMKDNSNILEIDNLHSYFFTDQGVVKAVDGVTFNVPQGATVGIVGESGCGKSVTSMSVMRLLQGPQGQIITDVAGMDGINSSIRFKSFDFKLGEDSKPIPIWENDENGEPIYDPVIIKTGKDPVWENDENGEPIYDPVLDKGGQPVLDEEGNPKTERRQKRDEKGKKVFVPRMEQKVDKQGQPILERRQKRDEYGTKVYEMEEKVFDIARMPSKEMYRLRGRQISMIFQEPMTSLNPVFTIGNQLDEVTLLHVPGATKEEAKRRSLEMLNLVGIAMPERVYASYPHELSGGMRQRVMIAMALEGNPRLIIADEPTTALDVTIQAQILDLLRSLKDRFNGSILLITHDLGVIAEMADYVVVMYAGRIIEQGTASEVFHHPAHPYTIGLQKSKPTMDSTSDTLFSIPGNVPNPTNMPNYCYFRERCGKCIGACQGDYPPMVQISPTHSVACYLYNNDKKESD